MGTQTVPKASAKEISTFWFPSLSLYATIQGTEISALVPVGTNRNALVASFSITGTSLRVGGVPQVSGFTSQDFSEPVSYVVIAEDGSTRTYTVTVTVAKSSEKRLTAFSLVAPAVAGLVYSQSVYLTVPYGTDLTHLTASFSTTADTVRVGGVVQKSGETINDFSHPVVYHLEAADGSFTDYSVTVSLAPRGQAAIRSFTFTTTPLSVVIGASKIDVVMPPGTDLSALTAVFEADGDPVSVYAEKQTSGVSVRSFLYPVPYYVTAPSGAGFRYDVTVTVLSYTVTFDSDGGSVTSSVRNIVPGSRLTRPANPYKSGSYFVGWYQDPERLKPWDFASDVVNGNLTLYGAWLGVGQGGLDVVNPLSGIVTFTGLVTPLDFGASMTVSAAADGAGPWTWYLDGVLDPLTTGSTWTNDLEILPGPHTLTATTLIQGVVYSNSADFLVQ